MGTAHRKTFLLVRRWDVMHLGIVVSAVIAVAFVVALVRASASHRRIERRIKAIAASAGYELFGPVEGRILTFRSRTTYLRVAWTGHGSRLIAALAPRPGARLGEQEWADDDMLRQVLRGEAADPAGGVRGWSDSEAFLQFLTEALPEFTEAVGRRDPELVAGITRIRSDRRRRWEEQEESSRR